MRGVAQRGATQHLVGAVVGWCAWSSGTEYEWYVHARTCACATLQRACTAGSRTTGARAAAKSATHGCVASSTADAAASQAAPSHAARSADPPIGACSNGRSLHAVCRRTGAWCVRRVPRPSVPARTTRSTQRGMVAAVHHSPVTCDPQRVVGCIRLSRKCSAALSQHVRRVQPCIATSAPRTFTLHPRCKPRTVKASHQGLKRGP